METKTIKKKKSHLLRNIIIALVGLILLLLLAKAMGWIGAEQIDKVETDNVKKRNITETVTANGKLQPETEVKISADISGEIIELHVREGQKVKKGDLLVRIKPDQYQREMEKASAMLNNSKANYASTKAQASQTRANLEKARAIFDRNKSLYEQKVISQADFENYQADYNALKAQYESAGENVLASSYSMESAAAGLKESQYSFSKTSIYAPMDGTISRLNVELGERVVGTMQMSGTEMLRIANLSGMEAEVDVNENDIPRLKLDDSADIEVDAFRGEAFKGIVTSISNSSGTSADQVSSEKVTNFKVKIRILEVSYKHLLQDYPGSTTPFRPGMSANVDIHTRAAYNQLTVPILAVTLRSETKSADTTKVNANADEVVFVYSGGKAVKRKVKTGIQDDAYIVIKEGLKEGDEIITGPYSKISKTLQDQDPVAKSEGEGKRKKKI